MLSSYDYFVPITHLFRKEYIRKWLADRGVLRTKDNIPISATDEDVAAFDNTHAGGPVAGLPIKMHWKSGFSSDWNRQAVFVLASDFLAEHTSCTITKDDLQDLIVRKLQRTRQEWLLTQTMQTQQFDRLRAQTAKKNRKRGRLHGVCLHLWIFRRLLMNMCRRPIIVVVASLTNILTTTQHFGVRSRKYMSSLEPMA
jgi:hypothetical protein